MERTPRNDIEPLMTLEEVADKLRIAPKTIRNRVSLGTIGAVKIGGALRFERAEVERLISAGRIAADESASAA